MKLSFTKGPVVLLKRRRKTNCLRAMLNAEISKRIWQLCNFLQTRDYVVLCCDNGCVCSPVRCKHKKIFGQVLENIMFSIQMHGLVPQPKLEMTKIFSLLIETIFLVVSLLTTVGANYYFVTANPSKSRYVNYITCMRF